MSRNTDRPNKGVKLPYALRKELGVEDGHSASNRRGGHGNVRTRKDQRKEKRQEKRANIRKSEFQRRPPPAERSRFGHRNEAEEREEDDAPASVKKPLPKTAARKPQEHTTGTAAPPKSILKQPKRISLSPSPSTSRSRSESPGLVLDANSRAFRDRAAQDDAEISALEKRLGLKKGKKPGYTLDDGLDDILGGLDSEEEVGGKRKREADDWLASKRRRAAGPKSTTEDDSAEESDDDLDLDLGDEDEDEDGDDDDLSEHSLESDLEDMSQEEADYDDDDDFNGLDDGDGSDDDDDEEGDNEEALPPKTNRVRENPYVAPVQQTASTAKYIPPSLRKAQTSDGPSLQRLGRQVQGHLNKLSEANLVSILGEIEKVYQTNPRQDVTDVLTDLLLSLFSTKSALQNTFVILHAAFATAVYKVMGVDFGAHLLSQLVDRFDKYHGDAEAGKAALNLLSLLSNLFTFHFTSHAIIFDYIRILLQNLSENNTELLLRLVRDCGPQLRQEDPTTLKSIVQLMQKEAARMSSAGEQMSVRTKFMIETITDLKNNKMKAATNNAGVASEHITQMRKALGSLNNRPLRALEPMRIGREDIKSSDRKGKWWLVGASWKGKEPEVTADLNQHIEEHDDPTDPIEVDLLALSRQYNMNTSVRRSIFIALLSAVDHADAHLRLMKLRLKRNQEQEIPHVLLRCAGGEKPYNHYYTLVAKRLCSEKKMKKAFMFGLWGFFRRMGETGMDEEDDNDPESADVAMDEIANIARLYAHLILDGSQTLGVLKVLDLAYIKERTVMFVELLLIIIMVEANKARNDLVRDVFERAEETPQIVKRLQFFLKKNVKKSDLVSKGDKDTVKGGVKVALEMLSRIDASGAGTMVDD